MEPSSQTPEQAPAAPGVVEPSPAGAAPPIDWCGGAGQDNEDALTFLIASENPSRGEMVWALQCLTASNWARLRGKKEPQIQSISDMLQSGLQHKKWIYDLGWGPQYDKALQITRWASTCAGSREGQCAKVSAPRAAHRDFVRRLLAGEVDLLSLRGKHGEAMPDPKTWSHLTSFLQKEGFSQIVEAQGGGAGHTVEETEKKWGSPTEIASVEGINFYGRGA